MQKSLTFISSIFFLVACGSSAVITDENVENREDQVRQQDPSGNNGTVKVQELGDENEIPDNDPHVGCKFKIEFRGYDKGELSATWELKAWPPSGNGAIVSGPNNVFIGEDEAGGANDMDAVVEVDLANYDLSGLYKHPVQGYHLKLTVHAEGSKGNDTKHKVFWTTGCQVPPPPPQPFCGNGVVEGEEQCDDGNDSNEDSCTTECTIPELPPPPQSLCGNGNLDEGEECDDGNVLTGDGCTPDCTVEIPPPPPPPVDCDGGTCDNVGAS